MTAGDHARWLQQWLYLHENIVCCVGMFVIHSRIELLDHAVHDRGVMYRISCS